MRQSANSTSQRRVGSGQIIAFAVLAYIPVLFTHPGRVVADTKSYLSLDASRFLSGAATMWDSHIGLGTVSHQTIGYMFPMGPFYRLFNDAIGVPPWITQRLWLGSLIFAAGMGMRYLLRTLHLDGPGVAVAVVAFSFTPYVLEFSTRFSVLLGPWAALPWCIAFVMRAMRSGGWKYPALIAVVTQMVGGVNASALIFSAIGPLFWIPYSVVVVREATWRRAWSVVWRTGMLAGVTSLWWISGLLIQGKYGLDILRFSESIRAVSTTSSPTEVLRGLGYWFFYGSNKATGWNTAAGGFTQAPLLIAASFAVPVLALLSAGVIKWRHRAYFVLVAFIGVVIAVGASPYDDPSPAGSWFKNFAASSTAGFALRSTARAVPLVALSFSVLLGAAVSAYHQHLRNHGRQRVALAVVAVPLLLCLVNAQGLWKGSYYSKYLERSGEIPQYWTDALAALDAKSHDTRVLALPGADFAAYRWGETVDPIEPGLIDRPYVGRELIPWGTAPSANLLIALDRRLQTLSLNPNAVAPIARLMGVGDVLLRLDLAEHRFPVVGANGVWKVFNDPRSKGLDPLQTFGTSNRADDDPPPIAVASVPDPLEIIRIKDTSHSTFVDGDAEGLVDLATLGLLDSDTAIIFTAPYQHAPQELKELLGDGSALILTDSHRKRAQRWSSLRDNFGYTEQAGETPLVRSDSDQRLESFPSSDDDSRTVTELRGVKAVRATSYGGSIYGYSLDARPALALDGDASTSWKISGLNASRGDQRLLIELNDAVEATSVELVQPTKGVARIDEVTLRFDGGRPVHARLRKVPGATSQTIEFSRRKFSTLEIQIDSVSKVSDTTALVGIAEVNVHAIGASMPRLVEVTRMPVDMLQNLGELSARHDLTLLMTPLSGRILHAFDLPTARSFLPTIEMSLGSGASDETIDHQLGLDDIRAGGFRASSSSRFRNDVAQRASSAIDGDPATQWTPQIDDEERWIRVQTPNAISFDHLNLKVLDDGLHSIPQQLTVKSERGETRTIDLRAAEKTKGAGVVSISPKFETLSGNSFTFQVTEIEELILPDEATQKPVRASIAIAELGIPGVRRGALSADLPGTCNEDLIVVDGKPVLARVLGSTADALAGKPLKVEVCNDSKMIDLDVGGHDIQIPARRETGYRLSPVTLTSRAVNPRADSTRVPMTGDVRVVRKGRTSATVEITGAKEQFWLVLGQSQSAGWHASVRGKDLGPAQLIDGFANGWRVSPGDNDTPITVDLEWTPQRSVNAAIWTSLLGFVLCLFIIAGALVRARRRGIEVPDNETPGLNLPTFHDPRIALGVPASAKTTVVVSAIVAIAAGIFVYPLIAIVVGPVTALVMRGRLSPRLTAFGPAVLLAIAGSYVAISQLVNNHSTGLNWVFHFDAVRTISWLSIMLLVVSVCADFVRSQSPTAADLTTSRAEDGETS